MKKLNTRNIRSFKRSQQDRTLQMLTCYDFQTASLLNETELDLILVGDSLGNVILGYDTTVSVSLDEMKTFGSAVKRGAPDKFVIVDMPFGTYATVEDGLRNAIHLFQSTKAEAVKMEGAFPFQLELVERLTQAGVPVMGHIGLLPQSVHQQGGYYTHGKTEENAQLLLDQALNLEKAGVFSIVLECVEKELATKITEKLSIPTIGIGSGQDTDGQVLVINDLFKMSSNYPPSFCEPIADLYQMKKDLIDKYLKGSSE
jgi:3-methyl-2-oxobutanoate hydroxymethyltransferase